eukprot:5061711-Pyramimonas_sp.AAC.1
MKIRAEEAMVRMMLMMMVMMVVVVVVMRRRRRMRIKSPGRSRGDSAVEIRDSGRLILDSGCLPLQHCPTCAPTIHQP